MAKKEMLVAAIKNGTVIDHIPTEKTYQVVSLLQLEQLTTPVTIGYNYHSKKLGRKGIIKAEDKYFTDEEKRDPSMTEIRVLDTYWSDHCTQHHRGL